MNLEKQVVSQKYAIKLRDLGVKQESYFEYYLYPVNVHGEAPVLLMKKNDSKRKFTNDYCYAYTVPELLATMPGRNKYWNIKGKWSNDWWLKISQCWLERTDEGMKNGWYVNYYSDMDEHQLIDKDDFGANLADQIAKVRIYLLENNLITP